MCCHGASLSRRSVRPRFCGLPVVLLAFCCLTGACKDEPELPPELREPRKKNLPPIDLQHTALVRGDRSLSVPNLVFVVQPGDINQDMAVTLTAARPAPDGSRLTFGTLTEPAAIAGLVDRAIEFSSLRYLDLTGNGVFTPTVSYQPKRAILQITKESEEQVEGTISGAFYRFNMALPTARPTVVELKIDFKAAVHIR